jgi:simple sugar transport system permease protein
VISFILICLVSEDPTGAMSTFLFGPVKTISRLGYIVEKMIPLMFTGVGVCIMFSCNQINLGGEGAFYLGGVISTIIAVFINLPSGLHPAVCILAAGLTGAIVCGLTGLFHIKFHSLTIVTSLMFNYVCLYIGSYLINYPLWDSTCGYQASFKFATTALLPKLFTKTNIHAGLFLAIVAVFIGHIIVNKSTLGYRIKMVGKNQHFARYSGINVPSTILVCQLIGGFFAGIGGAVEQLGMYERFQYSGLSGHGFDGVMIAVIAGFNPKYVPLAGLFLAYVRVGAEAMARMSDVPSEMVSIVQSIIIMLIIAEKFLANWKHKVIVKNSMQPLEKIEG